MRRALLALSGLAVLALSIAMFAVATWQPVQEGPTSRADVSADPAHTPPPAKRLLLVSRGAAQVSAPGQVLHGRFVAGALPQAKILATVLTDEDCAPDAEGVSHCLNTLRLANGEQLVVRHPHRMSNVPCLTPGEEILVRAV